MSLNLQLQMTELNFNVEVTLMCLLRGIIFDPSLGDSSPLGYDVL